jgi:hypothetical protein
VLVIGNFDTCTETVLSLSGVQWRGVAVDVAIAVDDVTITLNLRGQAVGNGNDLLQRATPELDS